MSLDPEEVRLLNQKFRREISRPAAAAMISAMHNYFNECQGCGKQKSAPNPSPLCNKCAGAAKRGKPLHKRRASKAELLAESARDRSRRQVEEAARRREALPTADDEEVAEFWRRWKENPRFKLVPGAGLAARLLLAKLRPPQRMVRRILDLNDHTVQLDELANN